MKPIALSKKEKKEKTEKQKRENESEEGLGRKGSRDGVQQERQGNGRAVG